MKFQDIILESFDKEEKTVYLEEGIILTPFLAFSVLKDKIINNQKNKINKAVQAVKDDAKKVKAKGQIFKEKAREEFGVNTEETVYKLTKEQKEVMRDIYAKYGKEIIKQIKDYRRDILAPYQLIKRYVKNNSSISSKDITGLTKEQFYSALESGRKKIEARGEKYKEKSNELQKKLIKYKDQIKDIEKLENDFKQGKIDYKILNKLYNEFDVGDKDLKGFSPEELKRIYNKVVGNRKELKRLTMKEPLEYSDIVKGREITKSQREIRKGVYNEAVENSIDLTKKFKNEFYTNKGNFKVALGKYFLRKDIVDELKPGKNNIYTQTYLSILNEMKKSNLERRKKTLEKLSTLRKNVEFNSKERKVWEKRPTVKYDSNKITDYYQKVKEEDFLNKPIKIQKNDKVIKAEKEISKAARKFEKDLLKSISEEDLKKLKKYRLINNLITIKELKNPNNLFKSENEIEKMIPKEKVEYMSPEEYITRVKELVTKEYDSIKELNKAKDEVEKMTKNMKANDEEEAIDEVKDYIKQFKIRRTLEPIKIIGNKLTGDMIVDINDIEDFIHDMLTKDYKDDYDQQKQDKETLNKMIDDYKENNDDAEEELDDIKDLLDKLQIKLTRGK